MGYRHYIYTIPKKNVEEARKLNLKEIKEKYGDEYGYVNYEDVLKDMKCIFEYGKLYWDDTVERIHSTGEPLFLEDEVQGEFQDFDIYLVGKEALKVTIEIYENKIKKMYEELNKEVEKAETFEDKYKLYKNHIWDYEHWWYRGMVIDLEKDAICQSWLYEHQIFELVRLYKTIDFEKYDLVFLGY